MKTALITLAATILISNAYAVGLSLVKVEGSIANFTSFDLDEFSITVDWSCENGWGSPVKEGSVKAKIFDDSSFVIPAVEQKCWNFSGSQFYSYISIVHKSGNYLMKKEVYSPSRSKEFSFVEINSSQFSANKKLSSAYKAQLTISSTVNFAEGYYSKLTFSKTLKGDIEGKKISFAGTYMAIPSLNEIEFDFGLELSKDHRTVFSEDEYCHLFNGEPVEIPLESTIRL